MSNFISQIQEFFTSGSDRSVGVKKNTALMFVIKGLSILINFLLVPLTIHYVNAETYGLWLTISSVVAWISYFDIGLNNGLRNKFAEAKAKGDIEKAHRNVSTTYAMLSLIFIPLMIIFLVVNRYIDWASVFKVTESMSTELATVMAIVVSFFCLKFILSTLNIILIADQRPAESSLRQLCENVLSLLVIFILTKCSEGSLTNLSLALCLSPLVILIIFSITLFSGRYKVYRPSLSTVDFKLLPDLFNLGIKFFVIQISALVLFQTSNIIIQREFGGVEVASYNVAFKYFSILTMAISIIVTPIWSASTDAYARGDVAWIKNAMNKLRKVFYLLAAFGVLMLAASPIVYKLWIGGAVPMPFMLSFWMLLYCLVLTFGSQYVYILNGIGALKIQFISSFIAPMIYLFCCYLFIRIFKFGIVSIIIASIISNFNGYLLAPIQFRKVFVDGSKGIWIQ